MTEAMPVKKRLNLSSPKGDEGISDRDVPTLKDGECARDGHGAKV